MRPHLRFVSGMSHSLETTVTHDMYNYQLDMLLKQRCKEFTDLLNSQNRKGKIETFSVIENYSCGAAVLPNLTNRLNKKLCGQNISPEEWLKRFKQDNDEIAKQYTTYLDRKNIAGEIKISTQHTYE